MISDALDDAAEEIRVYLREYPKVYAPFKERIDAVLKEMDAIRLDLDTPTNRTARD
jgi:hypothetical protein